MKALVVLLVAAALCSCVVLVQAIKLDQQEYKSESACVAEYIARGHERSSIITQYGQCRLKQD